MQGITMSNVVMQKRRITEEESKKHNELVDKLLNILDGQDMEVAVTLSMNLLVRTILSYFFVKASELSSPVSEEMLSDMLKSSSRMLLADVEEKLQDGFQNHKHTLSIAEASKSTSLYECEENLFGETTTGKNVLSIVSKVMEIFNEERETETRMTALVNITSFVICDSTCGMGIPIKDIKKCAEDWFRMFTENTKGQIENVIKRVLEGVNPVDNQGREKPPSTIH
jgi:hypothetical protein